MNVSDENISGGKKISVSATGKSNAAKAVGTGNLLFWCKVRNNVDGKTYVLERKRGEHWAVGVDDVVIGNTSFFIPDAASRNAALEIEAGYFYDSGYTGTVPPIPASLKRVINLTAFQG
ncbi:hypothetical protein PU683_08190 [Kosakonia cowanii]|uniref:hypothetical protein n=1 Tax=Kosakonia cowanii TaxID=208223 RepID=UPI0023F9061B|nr:hypothetical protein [Kosakonia cowanii]MDF7759508.1 hypothetical protein [Kosakonia cowanii]